MNTYSKTSVKPQYTAIVVIILTGKQKQLIKTFTSYNLGGFTAHTQCDVQYTHVYCRSVTEQMWFEITQQSLQCMADTYSDSRQEG